MLSQRVMNGALLEGGRGDAGPGQGGTGVGGGRLAFVRGMAGDSGVGGVGQEVGGKCWWGSSYVTASAFSVKKLLADSEGAEMS